MSFIIVSTHCLLFAQIPNSYFQIFDNSFNDIQSPITLNKSTTISSTTTATYHVFMPSINLDFVSDGEDDSDYDPFLCKQHFVQLLLVLFTIILPIFYLTQTKSRDFIFVNAFL